MRGLSCNRILADARPHLEHLMLLHETLRLPDIEKSYFGECVPVCVRAQACALVRMCVGVSPGRLSESLSWLPTTLSR